MNEHSSARVKYSFVSFHAVSMLVDSKVSNLNHIIFRFSVQSKERMEFRIEEKRRF